ncbi:MAG: transposase [Puia sp.]|nr:transposase [Puia sp.]
MDPKKPKENRRRYDADFKNEVLKMVESGRSVPEIAQSLGIGSNLIYYWVKQAKKGNSTQKDKAELAFDEEKLALQKRVKELEMEREILKKALGIFSRPQ